MDRPELVLTCRMGKFLGTCSLCPESVFKIEIETYDETHLKHVFWIHCKTIHVHEDTSQIA
jgi:hypothetical protein